MRASRAGQQIGDLFRVADVVTPAGVTVVYDVNFVVATVEGKRLETAEEGAEGDSKAETSGGSEASADD